MSRLMGEIRVCRVTMNEIDSVSKWYKCWLDVSFIK